MSSRSGYNDLRGERPILPPIQDLFRELATPHDSPSMTLARLRVGDEDRQSYLAVSSSRGQYSSLDHSQGHLKASNVHRYNDMRYNHHKPPPPSLHPLNNDLEDRYSPRGQSSYQESQRREPYHAYTSISDNSHPYTSQPWTSQYHHLDTSPYPTGPGVSQDLGTMDPRNSSSRHRPQDLSMNVPSMRGVGSEEAPAACHHNLDPHSITYPRPASEDSLSIGPMKYECNYCGKGFNRPSSLKIHLNSHTGEKPFVCPVESCGRSFSVLSNMRRHARVHAHSPVKLSGPSSDDESEQSSSTAASHNPTIPPTREFPTRTMNAGTLAAKWHHRRASSISTSSASSQRSQSNSPEDEPEVDSRRAEKRTRHHPK